MSALGLLAVLLLLAGTGGALFYFWNRSFKSQLEEKNKLTRSLQLVNELSNQIVTIMDMERLLPLAMDAFVRAGGVSKGSLMLINPAEGTLEIHASVNIPDSIAKTAKPKIGEGIAGAVAKSGQPILISDVSSDQTYYKDFDPSPKSKRPKESVLSLPLKFKGQVLGVVNLEAKSNGHPFFKQDETVLHTLANAVAVALRNAQLYDLAVTDGLTQLGTHRYFQVRLEQELNRAKRYHLPLTLALLDIDHFKNFNDTYGHPEGDRILTHVAQLTKECTRESDVCVRYGGEEFAMILTETNIFDAQTVAERLRKRVESSPILVNGKMVGITVSLGLASFKGEEETSKEELVHRADQALYRAKENGRNQLALWEDKT